MNGPTRIGAGGLGAGLSRPAVPTGDGPLPIRAVTLICSAIRICVGGVQVKEPVDKQLTWPSRSPVKGGECQAAAKGTDNVTASSGRQDYLRFRAVAAGEASE
jgi:hypothetical protein